MVPICLLTTVQEQDQENVAIESTAADKEPSESNDMLALHSSRRLKLGKSQQVS